MRHRLVVGVLSFTLAVTVLTPLPATATEPEASPVSTVTAAWPGTFHAPTWCRPVVNAAVDPAPLTCWLTLATDQFPIGLPGANLGDLPAWADVDADAIGAELTRYAEALEAERLAAEAAAAAARRASQTPRRGGTTTPPTSTDNSTIVWEEEPQYNPFDPNYEADWYEDPNGGFHGIENWMPTKPEGCGNTYSYDSRWGWRCG